MVDISNMTDKDVSIFSLKGHVSHCKVVKIIDGDSINIICYGLDGEIIKVNARLMGIDTPELNVYPHLAKSARNYLIQLVTNVEIDVDDERSCKELQTLIDQNTKLLIAKFGSEDKYGRQLVELYNDISDIDVYSRSINHMMIASKRARYYDGGKKQSWV